MEFGRATRGSRARSLSEKAAAHRGHRDQLCAAWLRGFDSVAGRSGADASYGLGVARRHIHGIADPIIGTDPADADPAADLYTAFGAEPRCRLGARGR